MIQVIRSHRFWLFMTGGWLVLGGAAHLTTHVWSFVLENGMIGLGDFAMNAMKQARSPNPLNPSLWRQFRLFSVSFALLQLFAGGLNLLLAWTRAPRRTVQAVALFATVFWTLAFIPFAFVDPVIQAIVIAVVVVPLQGLVYLTASQPEESP